MGGNLAASAVHEFSDRPPMAFVGAKSVPANPLPPDDLWYVRLADWLPAPQTQPRCGGSQQADGGTIFFEDVDAFAAEFRADAGLGLQTIDPEPESEQRVVLWMRDGDTTLRAVTIGGSSPAKGTKRIPEWIESPEEFELHEGFQTSQTVREHIPVYKAEAASPLSVWMLWANPLHG
jgi:hypothetical protein